MTLKDSIAVFVDQNKGRKTVEVANELTVTELGVPPGSAIRLDPNGDILPMLTAFQVITAGVVERTKFPSTAYNPELVRASRFSGGPKKANSSLSERWKALSEETDDVKLYHDASQLAKECKETIVSQAFISPEFTTDMYNNLCQTLMQKQMGPTFLLACVYFAEICWREAQNYIRRKFANTAVGEVYFVLWLDGCDTNSELLERSILTLPFAVPDRRGAIAYPGLEHVYSAYEQKINGQTKDSLFPSEVLSAEGQGAFITIDQFSDEVLAATEKAIAETAHLKESLQRLYEEGTARIRELEARVQAQEQAKAALEARVQQSEEQAVIIAQQARQFAAAVSQNADARVAEASAAVEQAQLAATALAQEVGALQQTVAAKDAVAQQAAQYAAQVHAEASSAVQEAQSVSAALAQETAALQQAAAAKDALIQTTAAKADEEARLKKEAEARAARRKAELAEKERRLADIKGQTKELQSKLAATQAELKEQERIAQEAREALPLRFASFEAKQKVRFAQAAQSFEEQVRAAAAKDVDAMNAQREAALEELEKRKASFARKDQAGKHQLEEAQKEHEKALASLEAARASLKRREEVMSKNTLAQLEFDGAAQFRDMVQAEKAENARLRAELDALKAKMATADEPSYNTALTMAPKEEVPPPVKQYQKIPDAQPKQASPEIQFKAVTMDTLPKFVLPKAANTSTGGDRWAKHRIEKPLALAKAEEWWEKHPRAKQSDLRQTAKNVVTSASDYIPGKNDFLGVDTKRKN